MFCSWRDINWVHCASGNVCIIASPITMTVDESSAGYESVCGGGGGGTCSGVGYGGGDAGGAGACSGVGYGGGGGACSGVE